MIRLRTSDQLILFHCFRRFINRGREETNFMTQLQSQLTAIRITILFSRFDVSALCDSDFLSNDGTRVIFSAGRKACGFFLLCRFRFFCLDM
jgi:hypothetical protein